jgi:peptidoglycan/xylan/chitin deacetylase (PgdA/CDA1 family)
MSILFFRNDDLRDKLDDSLIEITEIFIKNNIPLVHAVEPANITPEVVDWLVKIKQKKTDLIEIMQHGYDHKLKNKFKKGEFGGQRTYEEQLKDIKAGKLLMDKYFGDLWFPAFNFPYGPYNPAAIKAVNDCGFIVVNSHFNAHWSRKIFYFIGRTLKKGYLFNHHVSWNLDFYPKTNLFEIDMNISFIKRYINEYYDSEMYKLNDMVEMTNNYLRYSVIGILMHHRYHNNYLKIKLIKDYIEWCQKQDFQFMTLSQIFRKYSK